ncbi:transporter [Mesonia sp.]|uniref:transporter n=1 Tax=Mesonia sp. TaxID=1960830 RepID=UPI0017548ED9|nr:transporter [Mesonia sp.]HIB35982.1 transporter [Mesonia sp.]HIO27564.1 transporter [Flavobacteriaceae bacterium]
MKEYFTLIFLIVAFQFSNAQDSIPTISTDRPSAGYSSSRVAYKYLQIETGGIYEELEDNQFKQNAYTYNTTLLRYGLLENLEINAGWGFRQIEPQERDQPQLSGFSPITLGAKVGVTEQMGWVPKMTLFSQLTFPFGASSDFKNETTGVDVRMLMSSTLSSNSSLSYNLGVINWLTDSGEASYVYTFAYSYSFTERFGGFAEVYGSLPEDSRANHSWDAGLTYLIKNNLQVDLLVGTGFNTTQNYQVAAGLSYLLPK